MSARGWVERLSGARASPATQQPFSRARPGAGGPPPSGNPDRIPGPSGSRHSPSGPDPEGSAVRVVLVSRDNMLAGALRSLTETPGGVRVLDWYSDQLDAAIRHADVVIVDMPPNLHEPTFAVIDGRFLGRTVVLLQEGEPAEALPPGPPRAVLYRPIQIGELWMAVTGATPPAIDPAADPPGPGPEETPDAAAESAEVASAPPPASWEPEAAEPRPQAAEPEPPPAEPELPAVPTGEAPAAEAPVGEAPAAEVEPEVDGEAPAGDDEATDGAAAVEHQGLPVAESGRLIGLSGQELDPVIGPGQVAPGMDAATLQRLHGWRNREQAPAAGPTPATRPTADREDADQARAAQAAAHQAERAVAEQAKAAEAEARREQSARQQAARAAAQEEARQAKAARMAARQQARQARAAKAEAKRVARKARAEEARQAKAAEAEARRVAREAKAEQARQAKAERAEARAAAREQSRQAREARAEARAAAREEARQARKARAEARRAERAEARQASAAAAKARRAERAEKRRVAAAEAKVRRAERAEARRVVREETGQARAERAEARKVARNEARRARAEQAEARRVARAEARQARQVRAEARRVARAEAGRERAARRAEARQARATRAQERRAERAEAREAARAESRRAREARAEAWKASRAEARQEKEARAERRRAARAEARRARAARAEQRRAARAEAGQAAVAQPGAAARGRVGWVAWPALIVLAVAAVGLAAAGWRAGGGPDTLAGEVAAVQAAGTTGGGVGTGGGQGSGGGIGAGGGSGSAGGLVVQDPRVGPVEPLHALAVGVWLRATEAGGSLEGAVREARVPSRVLLAGVVVLSMLVLLLLMRVGPGTGAAAGPGPAPPHTQEPEDSRRRWRLGAAALAGALVALDPVLVRSGRSATGTVLAVVLALATLALAWAVPTRPALRWLPLVAAGGGLALLVSPLALPVLVVPVVAELLQGRHREAWRDMAALGLGIGLWLVLPIWVAGQGLDAGQAWSLLGRPPGRGAVSASVADAPLTWLLVAAGLAAAFPTWRHRSGARSDSRTAARLLAWTATTAAGVLVALVLGYPAAQALPFAVPAAAVSVAVAGARALAAAAAGLRSRAPAEGAETSGQAGAATGQARAATGVVPRMTGVGVALALAGLLVAQGVDWGARYRPTADDGLARLVATVRSRVPGCSAVNAGGPDDRARLQAAGVTVTGFSDGPAAQAAGVRYFVLTGATARGGPQTPDLAAWVRRHGARVAALPSRTLSGLELWHVDAPPLDPVADSLPVPDGVFSNVDGSACGGYRVVDSQTGAFYTAYQAVGGKPVLGRPLGSVWTSDGPALQAFDTMVLGAVPAATGPPAVAPIELPPLLAKLNVEAVADADIPLPSVRPPVTDRQVQALLRDKMIARAYLGTDPATASAEDRRRARARFGRPLGLPQVMPDGAVRQTFERVVLELPADGGPVRPAALGRLAVRLGLVPRQAMRPEPVPGLPARPASTRLDTGPLLRLVGGALVLLALAAGAGAATARRSRTTNSG